MRDHGKPATDFVSGLRIIVASDWKPLNKNTLKGVFTLTLPSGMVLHGRRRPRMTRSRKVKARRGVDGLAY